MLLKDEKDLLKDFLVVPEPFVPLTDSFQEVPEPFVPLTDEDEEMVRQALHGGNRFASYFFCHVIVAQMPTWLVVSKGSFFQT